MVGPGSRRLREGGSKGSPRRGRCDRRHGTGADGRRRRRGGHPAAAGNPLARRARRRRGCCSRSDARARPGAGHRRQPDARVLSRAEARLAAGGRAGRSRPGGVRPAVARVRRAQAHRRGDVRPLDRHAVRAALRRPRGRLVRRGSAGRRSAAAPSSASRPVARRRSDASRGRRRQPRACARGHPSWRGAATSPRARSARASSMRGRRA